MDFLSLAALLHFQRASPLTPIPVIILILDPKRQKERQNTGITNITKILRFSKSMRNH